METGEIRLVRATENANQEILVGLNSDTEITERIVRAVDQTGRLFPHVVRHVANNRLHSIEVGSDDDSGQLHEHMCSVRDELKVSLDGLRKARAQRLLQARNLTANVTKQRPPYFVR